MKKLIQKWLGIDVLERVMCCQHDSIAALNLVVGQARVEKMRMSLDPLTSAHIPIPRKL